MCWFGLNATLNFEETPIVFHMILCPQEANDFEHLSIARAAIFDANVIQFELRWTITDGCTENSSSIRDQIQHCHVFRGADGMIKRQNHDIRPQQDTRSSGRDSGECHQWRGPIMIANTMMLFEPYRIEPQFFSVDGLFESFFKVRAAFSGNKSKFHRLIPICEIDVAGTSSIRCKDYLPAIGGERRMRVTALIIAECIGVMSTKYLEYLLPISQMDFGDATRSRLTIRYHGLPINMQVVMSISAARCRVICFGITCTIRRTPTAEALCSIVPDAAVKTNSLAVSTPKF